MTSPFRAFLLSSFLAFFLSRWIALFGSSFLVSSVLFLSVFLFLSFFWFLLQLLIWTYFEVSFLLFLFADFLAAFLDFSFSFLVSFLSVFLVFLPSSFLAFFLWGLRALDFARTLVPGERQRERGYTPEKQANPALIKIKPCAPAFCLARHQHLLTKKLWGYQKTYGGNALQMTAQMIVGSSWGIHMGYLLWPPHAVKMSSVARSGRKKCYKFKAENMFE